MTSKEELQKHIQLLNEIKSRYPILNDTIKYLEKYQQSLSNPTISECIKEWEDRGYEDIENNNKSFSARNTKLNVDVYIDKRSKTIQISTCHYNYAQTIPFDLHNLIHKTIKALKLEASND